MEDRALRTNSNPHTRPEPKSWGEAIHNYRQSKQVLPYELPTRRLDFNTGHHIHANTNHPSVHPEPAQNAVNAQTRHPRYGEEGQVVVTRYTRARQEAAFNPITGKHLDTKIETGLKDKEATDMVTKANRGQDRALATETSYNVINFESKRQGLDPAPTSADEEVVKTYIPDSRVPYNIVSTLPHSKHHWARPELRPQETVVDPKTRFASKFIGRQPYNIINNRFLDKHDEKTANEATDSRFKAVKAFWKTHTYDPIQIKYYDEDKEQDFHRKHAESEVTQGQSVAENIRRNAPTAHLSEGNLYDPVTCQPKNEDAIKQLHRLEQGKAEHTQGVLRRVGEYLQNEDDFAAVQDDRALNRSKWKRFEDDHSHGFDIVNNCPHFGRGAAHKHLPKARPDASMWEMINEEALNGIDAQPLADIAPQQGQSLEREDRQVVNPEVPPIKTKPFTQEIQPVSQPRSQTRSVSQVGSNRSNGGTGYKRSVSQRSASQRSAKSVSASGRVRTGAFQHLEGQSRGGMS